MLDTTEVPAKDGLTYAPGENLLKPGDYILEWNQKKVATIQSLNREIQGTKDKKVTVLIRRNGEKIKIAMRPVLSSDGTYKIGTWVWEDTQGIGTLTYVTKTGEFGTLGHGITDVDTGTLYPHLNEVQRTAELWLAQIEQMPATNKETNQMQWVQHMNALKNQIEEKIRAELIYS